MININATVNGMLVKNDFLNGFPIENAKHDAMY